MIGKTFMSFMLRESVKVGLVKGMAPTFVVAIEERRGRVDYFIEGTS